jgi:hypothetical protein
MDIIPVAIQSNHLQFVKTTTRYFPLTLLFTPFQLPFSLLAKFGKW